MKQAKKRELPCIFTVYSFGRCSLLRNQSFTTILVLRRATGDRIERVKWYEAGILSQKPRFDSHKKSYVMNTNTL